MGRDKFGVVSAAAVDVTMRQRTTSLSASKNRSLTGGKLYIVVNNKWRFIFRYNSHTAWWIFTFLYQ